VAGYVVRDPSRGYSNWRAGGGLEERLGAEGVVGICDIDTRALTRHLRERGAQRVGVSSVDDDVTGILERVREAPEMAGANLVDEVTTPSPYTVAAEGEHRLTVAAIDLGIKRNTPRRMAARGITTHVLPASSTVEDIGRTNPDAVFLSNGPGDPATADHAVTVTKQLLRNRTPVFGICFGNQIVGRALGLDTYKLKYGHRGINQPVMDRATGKVEVTAHNHGFAVQAPLHGTVETDFGRAEVSHVCLNDNVVEGLRLLDAPAFSVQYHPEAAAGPHDADYLFDRLVELVQRA
jgi:carbamoyl-phosphate synthase small subunit